MYLLDIDPNQLSDNDLPIYCTLFLNKYPRLIACCIGNARALLTSTYPHQQRDGLWLVIRTGKAAEQKRRESQQRRPRRNRYRQVHLPLALGQAPVRDFTSSRLNGCGGRRVMMLA